MRSKNFAKACLTAACAALVVSVLAVALAGGGPWAAPIEEGIPLTSHATEPVTPFETFPFQLTLILVGIFAAWTLVNAVWSAPSDGAVAALRRLAGHPKVAHLYVPVSVDLRGGSRTARLVELGRRKLGLLSETPINAGESITIIPANDAVDARLHARVRSCRRRDGWYEVEARLTSTSRAERLALNDWMDRLDPPHES